MNTFSDADFLRKDDFMGLFGNKESNNNNYTDLSGINQNSYQQNNPGQYNSSYGGFSGDGYSQNPYAVNPQQVYGNSRTGISLSDYTRNVYLQMFIGLLITFGIGLMSVLNPEMVISFIGQHIGIFLIICGIEVVLVFILGLMINKLSAAAAAVIFYVYSIVNGITIAPAIIYYSDGQLSTVFWAIAVTAGIFGIMSFAGFVTKMDLSKIGPILFFGLIGLLIFSVVAMIFAIPMSDLIICVIGIILFMGFTIYDTKKIKAFYNASANDPERQKKTAIIAALQLYLDFINLFLYILRLFARNRR